MAVAGPAKAAARDVTAHGRHSFRNESASLPALPISVEKLPTARDIAVPRCHALPRKVCPPSTRQATPGLLNPGPWGPEPWAVPF